MPVSNIGMQVSGNEFTRLVRNLEFSAGDLRVIVEMTRDDLEHLHAVTEVELSRWDA